MSKIIELEECVDSTLFIMDINVIEMRFFSEIIGKNFLLQTVL
jgi:hypothetical protein